MSLLGHGLLGVENYYYYFFFTDGRSFIVFNFLFLLKVIALPQLSLCSLYALGFHGLTPLTVLWLESRTDIAKLVSLPE